MYNFKYKLILLIYELSINWSSKTKINIDN